MIKASEANVYSSTAVLSETYLFRKLCEDKIMDACQDGKQYCLVSILNFSKSTIISVYEDLIYKFGYSVTQRGDGEGCCLYIKWGHANKQDGGN